jgi:epoxide hydrolase-like predicted phosphatase
VSRIRAVVSDFGGVLTSPLIESFAAFQDDSGIPLEELGKALAAIAADGPNPLFELETGRMSEAEFLRRLGGALTTQLGRPVEMHHFGRAYFQHLHPNQAMIDHMRGLRRRGYRMAICTNNVREWEEMWRAMLPVDEIFELVVDSAYVGVRKPDRRIYEIVLDRLDLPADEIVFVDDVEQNVLAARELGMHAVHFRGTDQAIAELEAVLADGRAS